MEEEIQTTEQVTEDEKENLETNQPEGETPAQEEQAEQPQEPAGKEPVDYEKKFAESTRENQILQARLKDQEPRRELTNQPTETELKAAFPSWEFMSETEKELARGQLMTRRTADAALAAQQKRDEDEKWNNSLEFAITSNPDLSGKEREFKEFASKPTHRGAPVDVLVAAFLHRSTSTPKPKTTPRQVLEPGSGRPKDPVKPKKVTLEEAKVIRETDYKRYMELVRTGGIEEDL